MTGNYPVSTQLCYNINGTGTNVVDFFDSDVSKDTVFPLTLAYFAFIDQRIVVLPLRMVTSFFSDLISRKL
ncbi:hypothetical protein D3C81_1195380 [compost metagenome]